MTLLAVKYNGNLVFSNLHILQRAAFLVNDWDMEVAHSVAATAGDTVVFYLLNFEAIIIGGGVVGVMMLCRSETDNWSRILQISLWANASATVRLLPYDVEVLGSNL